MYENRRDFAGELQAYFDHPSLDAWHLIEVRYPELLADYLTSYPDFQPPMEQGIRVGKRPDHYKGGRRNLHR